MCAVWVYQFLYIINIYIYVYLHRFNWILNLRIDIDSILPSSVSGYSINFFFVTEFFSFYLFIFLLYLSYFKCGSVYIHTTYISAEETYSIASTRNDSMCFHTNSNLTCKSSLMIIYNLYLNCQSAKWSHILITVSNHKTIRILITCYSV